MCLWEDQLDSYQLASRENGISIQAGIGMVLILYERVSSSSQCDMGEEQAKSKTAVEERIR